MRHEPSRRVPGVLIALAFVASACAGGSSPAASAPSSAGASAAASAAASTAPTAGPSLPTAVGPGEGRLDLAAWAYYVVGGTGGEQGLGADWVTDFETKTGCKTYVKVYGGSSERWPPS